ncbi:hypothetical protein K437DRAFT_258803 [Tilletiaria anomala UBC 951]|uniref:WD40 repeat-like protein n=1 Tax=Tilletiaria anomala (strain ATCC 24038 / CBS 436.72 / UBC 951) TaxID=1037660 RepID=A0A066VN63_TILAU|nr:uncharacterized protein K437DRAFT_258803 [Tilletiaria anomala UBC 951]KDN40020.1 hypothetical protein K437DRAFT_258803 [Tilletiaria anomala UBC 951]
MEPLPVHHICSSCPVTFATDGTKHRWLLTLTADSASLYSCKIDPEQEPKLCSKLRCDLKPEKGGSGNKTDSACSPPLVPLAFPRVAAFSPEGNCVALTGDDKTLRIWKFDAGGEGEGSGFAYGKEVLLQHIPKRASVLRWEDNEHLIVADRHGDVRVFSLQTDSLQATLAQNNGGAPSHKRQHREGGDGSSRSKGITDEDPSTAEACLRPRLGHVSTICDLALAPFPSHPSTSPALIITSDRDEHIRVSRWGTQRAGWVIENFLHGSRSFVGALQVVPQTREADGRHINPWALLSSDGGTTLRVWDYMEKDVQKQCIGYVELDRQLAPHVRKEALPMAVRFPKHATGSDRKGKGKSKGNSKDQCRSRAGDQVEPSGAGDDSVMNGAEAVSKDAEDESALAPRAEEEESKLAITQLELLGHGVPTHVLLCTEASSALLVLPLKSIFASSTEGLQVIQMPRPILHVHVQKDIQLQHVLIALDVRHESRSVEGSSGSINSSSKRLDDVQLLVWKDGQLQLVNDGSLPTLASLQADQAQRNKATPSVLASLDLYTALQLYEKTSAEGNQISDRHAAAPEGCVTQVGRKVAGRARNLEKIFGRSSISAT